MLAFTARMRDGRILAISMALIALCACQRISSGKREAMRPAVAALVEANARRDEPGTYAFDELVQELRRVDAAGDPSLAGDIKASRDLRSCGEAIESYRTTEMADYKKESGESADRCVAVLKAEFQ
jgi:hypothetical protein